MQPPSDEQYSAAETERRREAALKKMLATPPKPHAKPKPKVSPGKPATKAERAAQKRSDKTVIKRMRRI